MTASEPPTIQSPLPPETLLQQRYRLIGLMGQGEFGWHYVAEDQQQGNELCILEEFIPGDMAPEQLEQKRAQWQQGVAALGQLNHPQLPRFWGSFVEFQRLFWVRDYIPGQSYRVLLTLRREQGYVFSEAEVIHLIWNTLPVLAYLHNRGIVHRNLSPDSIMLRETDLLPVLTDFGLMKQWVFNLQICPPTPGTEIIGKWGYAPVEQIESGQFSRHSDLYALAVTCVVLLTGQEPYQLFDAKTWAWQWEQWVTVDPRLARILRRMMLPNPSGRYQSAGKVAQALRPLVAPGAAGPVTDETIATPEELAQLPGPTQTTPPQSVTSFIPPATAIASQPPAGVIADPAPPPPQPPDRSDTPPTDLESIEPGPADPDPDPVAAEAPEPPFWRDVSLLALASVFVVLTGVAAWRVLSLVQNQQPQPNPSPEAVTSPTSPASPAGGSSPIAANPNRPAPAPPSPSTAPGGGEQVTQAAIRDRRRQLGIDYNLFVNLVDDAYFAQYPDQRNRRLDSSIATREARADWNQVASKVLDQLSSLSASARQGMGSYRRVNYDSWLAQADQLNLSQAGLDLLADHRFFHLFPEQKGKTLEPRRFGQVWYAIVRDQVRALQSGAALEKLQPGSEDSGTLKPGESKAYVVPLQQGKAVQVQSQSTGGSLRLTVLPPTGAPALVQESTSPQWSGKVPRSGTYQFIITPDGSETVNYQLQLSQ